MKFERAPFISETNRTRALAIIEKTKLGVSYPAAVRQVLRNEFITDEADVSRIIKELSSIVDMVKKQQDFEEAAHEAETARMQEEAAFDVAKARQDHLLPEED
jgi:hypothetical protein